MPRAHLCTTCGEDLALIAPMREPHYGWPMVACPGCDAKAVRWEGHDRRMWRRTRKRAKAIAGLKGRVDVFALLTLMNLAACAALTEEAVGLRLTSGVPSPLALLGFSLSDAVHPRARLYDKARAEWFDQGSNLFLLVLWAFSALLASVFLVILLRHLRWWLTIPTWGAWLFGVNCAAFLGVPTIGLWLAPEEKHWAVVLAKGVADLGDTLSWIVALTCLSILMVPIAMLAKRTVRSLVHRQRWRTRRRIRRSRQTA